MSSVVRTRLANGLTILHEAVHTAPVVAMQAWVKVGAADEEAHEAGLAHLHEHMLFKGTKRRAVGELARTIEAAGGELNAWTSLDQTVYHVTLAAADAFIGLDVLSDALCHSTFEPEELRREIEVVLEEISRSQDSPGRRLSNALFELAYTKHPYRLPVLGTAQSVRSFTRAGILDFYARHYRPTQVTLVVVGDITDAQLQRDVERTFGPWRAGPEAPPRRPRPSEPLPTEMRVRVLAEDVKEARLALAWPGPNLAGEHLAAVDVLATILGHGESSRLYHVVRRSAGLVNDIQAYGYTPQDPGLFTISAALKDGDVSAALRLIVAQAHEMSERSVSAAELHKAQTLILSDSAYARETAQGQARKLGFFETAAGDYAFEAQYMRAVAAVDAQAVRDAAAQLLALPPTVVVQAPAASAPSVDDVAAWVQEAGARLPSRRRAPPGKLGVERVQLSSGAVLLLAPDDSPLVNVRAVALGGQRYETAATAGHGNLFASVWGTATQQLGPQELAQRFAELAGSVAGFCGRNTCGLSAECIAAHYDSALPLFCDLLCAPRFEQSQLERERQVMLERQKSRDDSPGLVAFETFARALHPTHSYGLPLYGSEASVHNMRLEDLGKHRTTFLAPCRLVVAVVGGFDIDVVLQTLSEALADPTASELPPIVPPDAPPQAPIKIFHPLARQQAHVMIGAMGARLNGEDRFGLETLSTVLSGQSGRLFIDLRDRQSLAYAISSANLEGLDPGHFWIHVGTHPDKVEKACAGVYAHLERLIQEQVSADELARAKRYLIGTHAIELQRGGARAMLMALHERYGLGYDHHTHYAEHIEAVDSATLQQLAQRYLSRERLVEVVVGPAAGGAAPAAAN